MAKQLKDILKKAKSDSKLVPNRVSDMLKPGDEKKFASKHLIQKYADRNGNDKGVFDAGDVHYDLNFKDEKRHGRKIPEDEKVYEAMEKENTKCNESAKGTMCEVHGMTDCKKAKPLTEKDEDKPPFKGPYDKPGTAKDKNVAKNAARKAMKKFMTKEEYVTEVNISKHFDNWMSSEDAPEDHHSGDYDKVNSLAKSYLSGSGVPKEKHDDVAEKLTDKFHGEFHGVDESHRKKN